MTLGNACAHNVNVNRSLYNEDLREMRDQNLIYPCVEERGKNAILRRIR